MSSPLANTAMVRPPDSRVVRWAIPSMPLASPLTTVIPFWESSLGQRYRRFPSVGTGGCGYQPRQRPSRRRAASRPSSTAPGAGLEFLSNVPGSRGVPGQRRHSCAVQAFHLHVSDVLFRTVWKFLTTRSSIPARFRSPGPAFQACSRLPK